MASSDPFRPELRLFLSVDLVGSTSFKQQSSLADKNNDKHHSWLSTFCDFYKDFQPLYISQLEKLKSSFGVEDYVLPRIWKRLGDELILSVLLERPQHPLFFVECFRRAALEYEKTFQNSKLPLSLKCTAWTAGFPVRNVKVPGDVDEGVAEDYIGPYVDIGFRLATFSTVRKFVLSVELVWIILFTLGEHEDFKLFYDGKLPVKGFRGGEYPVFWISKRGKIENDKEMILLNLQHCQNAGDVKLFCEDFLNSPLNDLQIPFIFDEEQFKKFVPEDYLASCEEIKRIQVGSFGGL